MRLNLCVRALFVCLISASAVRGQAGPDPQFCIAGGLNREKIQQAVSQAAANGYRIVAGYGDQYLMERSGKGEAYQYVFLEDSSDPTAYRNQLNTYGARGYRLLRSATKPAYFTVMEKPPGRPNQFQYVLEVGHRIRLGKFGLPKDDFSSGPVELARRAQQGYSWVAQNFLTSVLEKAAEPTGEPAPCANTECYEIRTLDTRKHFEDTLNNVGTDGFRILDAAGIATWSTTAILVGLQRALPPINYEYRVLPARLKKLVPALTGVNNGYCPRAVVGNHYDSVVIFDRTATERCDFRLAHGAWNTVERDLEAATQEGFRPTLMVSENHHHKMEYAILLARAGGGGAP
jgi:hypothetical protein